MNKFVNASIAAAAGVALLLGGAGTFATWNASAATTGSSISAGNLVVQDSGTAGTWTANGSPTPISLSGYTIVPGDVLTYTKTMKIGAEGDNLKATLALTPASITAADPTKATDQALAGYLSANAVLTASGPGISGTGPTFTVTPGAGTVAQNVTVTVTISFPKGDVVGGNNNAMNGAVTLSDLAVSLTQVTA
jgi:alternate signal-mediated exported protein